MFCVVWTHGARCRIFDHYPHYPPNDTNPQHYRRPAPAPGNTRLLAPFLSDTAMIKCLMSVFSSPECPAHPPSKWYQSASEWWAGPACWPGRHSSLAARCDLSRTRNATSSSLSLISSSGCWPWPVTTGSHIRCPVRAEQGCRGAFLVLNERRGERQQIASGSTVRVFVCLNVSMVSECLAPSRDGQCDNFITE